MSNFAPAVEAATKVMEFIANENTEVGISEICKGTDINKNMVFRILNTLEEQGWVYCNEQKYGLTLVPFQIASKALSKMTLNNAAYPSLYKLWQKTGESTYLGVLKGRKVSYLQHFDGTGDVREAGRTGGENDAYCSAPGKVLLAYSEQEVIGEYLQETLKPRTENTITDKKQFLNELENICLNGYGTDKEEFGNGITCVAAPVFDYTGKIVASVGCSAFTLNGDSKSVIERLKPAVLEAAKQITVCLGKK